SIEWTSKYGSVIASGYDLASTDGANEKGLNVNLLWLVESEYPNPQKGDKTLSMSLWGQYVLD
ncbi:choloylglycine hydrolase, partial [Alcaligenes pakistanensis]